jgi:hypothetical protein
MMPLSGSMLSAVIANGVRKERFDVEEAIVDEA